MSYALPAETIAAFRAAAQDIHAGTFRQRGKAARGVNPFAVVSIWQADDVPAGATPGWLAHALFGLGQHLARDHWVHLYEHLAWAGARWSVLDDAAWERLRRDFARWALEHLVAVAAPMQPDPAPRYWRKIAPVVQAVIRALRGDGELARATDALRAWSIPEGYDLWDQENATYEAMSAAHRLATAAHGLDDDDGHVMSEFVQEAIFTGPWVETPCFLLRTLLQGLVSEISAAQWP
jgi:hypothetical protein